MLFALLMIWDLTLNYIVHDMQFESFGINFCKIKANSVATLKDEEEKQEILCGINDDVDGRYGNCQSIFQWLLIHVGKNTYHTCVLNT